MLRVLSLLKNTNLNFINYREAIKEMEKKNKEFINFLRIFIIVKKRIF